MSHELKGDYARGTRALALVGGFAQRIKKIRPMTPSGEKEKGETEGVGVVSPEKAGFDHFSGQHQKRQADNRLGDARTFYRGLVQEKSLRPVVEKRGTLKGGGFCAGHCAQGEGHKRRVEMGSQRVLHSDTAGKE